MRHMAGWLAWAALLVAGCGGTVAPGSLAAGETRIGSGEEASLSPDGTALVFQRLVGGAFRVGVRTLKTGEERWMPGEFDQAIHPEWGPKNTVLFSAREKGGERDAFNLYAERGGKVVRLTEGRHRDFAPSFGRGGTVYFSTDRSRAESPGKRDLWLPNHSGIAAVTAGRPDSVTNLFAHGVANSGVCDPHLSPDGRTLLRAEITGYSDVWHLVTSPLDDLGRRTELTPRTMVACSPNWSPDGKTVAFAGCREGDDGWQVYLVPAAGGEPRRVAKGENPSFAPDGRSVVYDRDGVIYRKGLEATK